MTRSFTLFLFAIALFCRSSSAWVVAPVRVHPVLAPTAKGATSTSLGLHPNQAKELEEFARDLMKEPLEDDSETTQTPIRKAAAPEKGKPGIWAWCKDRLTKTAINSTLSNDLHP